MDNVALPRVLLIDVDNMVGVACTPRPAARARLAVLLAAAGPVHHAVAAYNARGDSVEDPLASHLAELGVGCIPVDGGPDAADRALLEHARRVHDTKGCGGFVIASADGRFARLASLGTTEVLAWQGQPVAARLRDAAHRVHHIPRPGHRSDCGHADRPAQPVCATVSDTSAMDAGAAHAKAQTPWPQGRDTRSPTRRAGAVLGLAFAAGVGASLGKRLVDALLPAPR